ncbi:ABC transporter permease [Pseudomonas sp. ABC1]|uniref:ABC transporter permease n=1 Tax=Pseudomonas sp. ABC1 TaxID=2748080 RepID=UPI0015C3367B|nr:ABC transporter permease [Pseudomonas sp. ABC1]QLF93400.1 ABC transporter permease [Pseudomonas sp. ABC1]
MSGHAEAATQPLLRRIEPQDRWRLVLALAGVLALASLSLFIGVGEVSLAALLRGGEEAQAALLLSTSRLPRTLSLVLAGAALSIAGLVMQMIARNRFVEPSTAGTVESASFGILVSTLLLPGLPVIGKMLVAAGCALIGTLLFLQVLRRVAWHSILVVPLVGLMLGGVIDSVTVFLAYRYELLQSLAAWNTGDFSSVLQGRYELLWIAFALASAAYLIADRLTVVGLGEAIATSLGVNHRRVVALGLLVVAMITAVTVTTVGMIPFLGLIVPNLVSMAVGDNARRSIPWVAIAGAGFVLLCDMAGRLVRYPYEIPAGTIAGVIGCAVFLFLLLRPGARHG